jgi:hypothetical protein
MPGPAHLRVLALLCLAASLALVPACSPAVQGRIRELPASARARLSAAPAYYAQGAGPAEGPETERLRRVFEGALAPEVRANMRHDPALDLAAQVIAEAHSEGKANLAEALIQWIHWRAGGTAIPSRTRHWWQRGGDRARDLDAVAGEFARSFRPSPAVRAYGVARFSQGKLSWQAIVTAHAAIELKPFAKSYAPAAPLTLEIRPLDASKDFVLAADAEDGKVVEEKLAPRPDGSFFLSRPVPTKPGRYFVEIRARDPRGVAADGEHPWMRRRLWVPIYVGVPEPAEPDDFIRNPLPAPENAAEWPAWTMDFYDAARARAGKPPIERPAPLAQMAEQRAAEVAAEEDTAPVQGLRAQLEAAGLKVKAYDQSHGSFDSVSDRAHMRLLMPSARKRLVLSDRLVLGIGIAPHQPDAEGRVRWWTDVEYTVVPR